MILSLLLLLALSAMTRSAKMVNQQEIMKLKKEAERQHETKKEELLEELQDAQILKEWEIIVKNLNDDQLDNIEDILAKDLERSKEFEMIMEELKAMGMDRQDISDLKQLAELMHEFLINVPNLKLKLEIVSNNDLLDNIQVVSAQSCNVRTNPVIHSPALPPRSTQQAGPSRLHCPPPHPGRRERGQRGDRGRHRGPGVSPRGRD